jgi:hypothetical protein
VFSQRIRQVPPLGKVDPEWQVGFFEVGACFGQRQCAHRLFVEDHEVQIRPRLGRRAHARTEHLYAARRETVREDALHQLPLKRVEVNHCLGRGSKAW